MAEFGPKVFHALGYLADAKRDCTFVTEIDPEKCGLPKSHNGESTTAIIECAKNAIFKAFMLRARNMLYLKHILNHGDTKSCEVTLTIEFNESFLHAESKQIPMAIKSSREHDFEASLTTGGDFSIVAELVDLVLPESWDTIQAMQNVSAVSGSPTQNKFPNSTDFGRLPI